MGLTACLSYPELGGNANEHNIDWFSMTQEEVTATNNPFLIYRGSKTATDQAMLEFSKDYPELDLSFGTEESTCSPYFMELISTLQLLHIIPLVPLLPDLNTCY